MYSLPGVASTGTAKTYGSSPGTSSDAKEVDDDKELENIGTYGDFHTIDWLREMSRNRLRHRQIHLQKDNSCFDTVKSWHDAGSGWLLVFLIGLAAGMFGTNGVNVASKRQYTAVGRKVQVTWGCICHQ